MKKSLIALTVVGALSLGAAQAETVLYGSIRFDYQNTKDGIGSSMRDNAKDRTSNLTDQGSRIGLKGGEDLGNGVQVIYHLEWGFDGMEGGSEGNGFHNRLAYIGLATDFGTFVAGRLDNPFKGTVVDGTVTDDFNSFGQSAAMRAVTSQFAGGIGVDFGHGEHVDSGGNIIDSGWDALQSDYWVTEGWGFYDGLGNYQNHGFGLDRVSNAIAYLSPNWNGFSFNAALIMDDDIIGDKDAHQIYRNKKHVDVFTLNAMYEHESGFYGKVGYIQGYTAGDNAYAFGNSFENIAGLNRKTRAFAAQLGYRTDQIGVSLSYADAKLSDVSYTRAGAHGSIAADEFFGQRKDKASGWDIGASYSFGDNYASTVRIAYGETRYNSEDNAWGNQTTGGATGGVAYYSNSIKPKDKIWSVGFEQKLSERTRVWAEYQNVKQSGSATRYNNNINTAGGHAAVHGADFSNKNDTFAIGIRHDF